jgi:hypothetical protein
VVCKGPHQKPVSHKSPVPLPFLGPFLSIPALKLLKIPTGSQIMMLEPEASMKWVWGRASRLCSANGGYDKASKSMSPEKSNNPIKSGYFFLLLLLSMKYYSVEDARVSITSINLVSHRKINSCYFLIIFYFLCTTFITLSNALYL